MIIDFYNRGGGGGGYTLPTATESRLGGIKVGSGLTVQEDGTLSSDGISSAQTSSAITQAMEAETARTEQTYAKTSAFGDYYTSAQTNSAITQAVSDKVSSTNISQVIKITQSDYDTLTAKTETTLYVIVPDPNP